MDTRLRMPGTTPSPAVAGRFLLAIATIAIVVWGSIIDPSPFPGVIFILIVAWAGRGRWRGARGRVSSPAAPRSHRS